MENPRVAVSVCSGCGSSITSMRRVMSANWPRRSSARRRRSRPGHGACGTSCGTRPEESDGCFQSAAQYYGMKPRSKSEAKAYSEAYGYLLKHHQEMNYRDYKAIGLPIGSGVTEAAVAARCCFTQRFKQSGMKWRHRRRGVILRLREASSLRVWDAAYREYLNHRAHGPTDLPHWRSAALADEKSWA